MTKIVFNPQEPIEGAYYTLGFQNLIDLCVSRVQLLPGERVVEIQIRKDGFYVRTEIR